MCFVQAASPEALEESPRWLAYRSNADFDRRGFNILQRAVKDQVKNYLLNFMGTTRTKGRQAEIEEKLWLATGAARKGFDPTVYMMALMGSIVISDSWHLNDYLLSLSERDAGSMKAS